MEKLGKQERHSRVPESEDPGATAADIPIPGDAPCERESNVGVQVISGASVQTMPLVGLRVSQARELTRAVLQVDPQAMVLVNGQPAPDDFCLSSGDALEFVYHAGEKG